jgi:hypothetical protein
MWHILVHRTFKTQCYFLSFIIPRYRMKRSRRQPRICSVFGRIGVVPNCYHKITSQDQTAYCSLLLPVWLVSCTDWPCPWHLVSRVRMYGYSWHVKARCIDHRTLQERALRRPNDQERRWNFPGIFLIEWKIENHRSKVYNRPKLKNMYIYSIPLKVYASSITCFG